MIRVIVTRSLAFALIGLPGGCATVPKDAGFATVEQTVNSRTGQHIHWNQGTAADRDALQVIRTLLRKDPLTETDAIQVALLANLNLQATYEELGIAQADLVEAGLLRNPTLSLEVRFPSQPALPYEINLTQTFIDLLLLPLRKKAAEASFEVAKLRVTHEVLKTVAEVKTAFYRGKREQLVELRRQVNAATAASLEASYGLHEAGNITDLSYANECAMYEGSKVDLAQAEAVALDTREELNVLMGVWGPDTQWKLANRLPALPPNEISPGGLESLAISQRADLGAARQQVELAAQGIGMKRFAAFSDINVGAHIEKDAGGELTSGPAIDFPLPLFNQGQPALAAAQAMFRQSRARYAALAVEIRGEIRRKRNTLIATRQRAEYLAAVLVPLQHQIVHQSQLQFNAMSIGVFQLLEAKRAEIEAGRDYVQALQDYWVARAELEQAVGGKLPPGILSKQPVPPDSTVPSAEPSQSHHPHGE